jgi:tRNA dimethylallyltransferase
MRSVGYRQLWAHLDGDYDLAEALRRTLAATRQLAKRQLTWMRSERRAEWLEPAAEGAWSRDICHALHDLGF